MALKDDIEGVKKEIGTEEQFLESVIKSEIFVKKYKKPLIFLAAVLIVAFIGYYANEFLSDRSIASANVIYDELLNKRDDTKLAELKQKDINLYALYILQNGSADERAALENTQGIDVVLKEIINLQNGKQGGVLLADYDSLLKGYDLLKEGKIEQAHAELDKIPLNSPVRQIALALKHYGGNK